MLTSNQDKQAIKQNNKHLDLDLKVYDRLLIASNSQELMEVYDQWSQHYDGEVRSWGWTPPLETVSPLYEFVNPDTCIVLDAACGTGLVGTLLQEMGFNYVDAFDLSDGMLEKAREKRVYRSLKKIDLNEPLPIESDLYDVVTCAGTFTVNHIDPHAIKELVRVTKPNGIVSFTVRKNYWDETNFLQILTDMQSEEQVKIERIADRPFLASDPGNYCKQIVLSKRS